ncbi:MAG: hypothetical protein JO353_09725 [Phycisphaerae bacterium]|nr:hypothetical protein [Phycisphaerae bacterium]
MKNLQHGARTLTLSDNFGERIVLAAQIAVREHLRIPDSGEFPPQWDSVVGGADHESLADLRMLVEAA